MLQIQDCFTGSSFPNKPAFFRIVILTSEQKSHIAHQRMRGKGIFIGRSSVAFSEVWIVTLQSTSMFAAKFWCIPRIRCTHETLHLIGFRAQLDALVQYRRDGSKTNLMAEVSRFCLRSVRIYQV